MGSVDASDSDAMVVRDMQHWLERAVIGLNLCPFAKAVLVRRQIHYVVSRETEPDPVEAVLRQELLALAAIDPQVRDTTLLMLPQCMASFLDFNDFLDRAERCLCELDLDGVLQIASFHPQFQFAGTDTQDISNFTNRAPYPTLHLLREASVDRAVDAFPQAESIYERNIETLRNLGHAGWAQLGVQRSVPVPQAGPTQRSVRPVVPGRRGNPLDGTGR